MRVELAVEVRPRLETLERGGWCSVCRLPSAVAVEFEAVAITGLGVGASPLRRVSWCPEHDGPPS